jgi:predicted NBD/HSP70 family sugar kinase
MLSLHDHLEALAADPRAVRWTVRLHAGWSISAPVREYVLFAPPSAVGARAVLSRLHNGILLHNPAVAWIDAPVAPERLEPMLGALRSIHHIRIALAGEELRPSENEGGYDIPSVDAAPLVPPGEGLAAGLDIGGTGMKACVLRDGVLLRAASAPTWPDGEQGIGSLIARARALIVEVSGGAPLGSLGIGFASPMAVGGRVLELSTIMRAKVGDLSAFDRFPQRVAEGLVQGPVAMFNDLANLGRYLSAQGARRLVRLQIGTSFGGCWIDSNGTVYATEMGRLIVDLDSDAIPHTYLPIAGAVRQYLSNRGLADDLGRRLGRELDPRTVGHLLRDGLTHGDPHALAALERMGAVMRGVVHELHDLLPGVKTVECGGSMLSGPAGNGLSTHVVGQVPVEFTIAARPGHDGAIAAALAPRVEALLKGMKRVG